MSATLSRPPVPAQFRGQAREFRDRLMAEDPLTERLMDRTFLPIRDRLARGQMPRPGTLEEAERVWTNEMPSFGRISLETKMQGRTHLKIRELRVSAASMRLDEWDEPGTGLAVLLIGISVDRRRYQSNYELLAGVTLHSLGRFYQRGFDTSHTGLRFAMHQLATAIPAAPTSAGASFSLPVSSGHWLGRVQIARESPVLIAKTFLSEIIN